MKVGNEGREEVREEDVAYFAITDKDINPKGEKVCSALSEGSGSSLMARYLSSIICDQSSAICHPPKFLKFVYVNNGVFKTLESWKKRSFLSG